MEVVSTNLGIWYGEECLGGIAIVENVRGIQYGHPMFGGKGGHSSFYLDTYSEFDSLNGCIIFTCKSSSSLNFTFPHLLPSSVIVVMHTLTGYICKLEPCYVMLTKQRTSSDSSNGCGITDKYPSVVRLGDVFPKV